ncbi:hypothetical protein TNCV_3099511 [Trichonephila clavipes]|nr:hypothetical protein TNCV_3099511 [Trichonephila clavipes]
MGFKSGENAGQSIQQISSPHYGSSSTADVGVNVREDNFIAMTICASVCLSRRRLPPVRITSLELLLSPRQLCRSACRRETLLTSGISENHSVPSLDCTVGGQSVPIQKI